MSGKPAARLTDSVLHPIPPVLTGGPVSVDVIIGGLPAWLGVNPVTAAIIQEAKKIADDIVDLAEKETLKASGTPAFPGVKAAEEATKATVAASMGALITGLAAGGSIHGCQTPYPPIPHGPGAVIDGSTSVLINGFPACFQGNTIIEALGAPPNQIMLGDLTVLIGSGPAQQVSVDTSAIASKMQADVQEAAEKAKEEAAREEAEKEKPNNGNKDAEQK